MISSAQSLQAFLRRVYVPSRLELAPGSIEQLEIAIRLLERWAGRSLSVSHLNEQLLRAFLAEYRRTHAAATTNSKRRHLLGLWQAAYDEGLVDRPPRRRKVRTAREPQTPPEAFTLAEVGRLLLAAESLTGAVAGLPAASWWGSILRVAYDTGQRRGAILATTPGDLDLAGGCVLFRRTKTGLVRLAPLHPETVGVVAAIFDPTRRLMWPWPTCRRNLDRWCARLLRLAGVRRRERGLFQTLRRTSGTLVEANGGDGSKHLGNTRAVFERHYLDPRAIPNQLGLLPRPE